MSQSRLPAPPRAASESTNGNGEHQGVNSTPPSGMPSVSPKSPGEILFEIDGEVREIREQSQRIARAEESTARKVDALITEQRKMTLWRESMERDQRKRDEVLFSLVEVPRLLAAQAQHTVDLQLAVVAVSGKTQELADRIGAPPANAIDHGTGLIGKVNELAADVKVAIAKADAAAKTAEAAEDKAEQTGKRHVSDLERRASSHEALLTEHARAALAVETERARAELAVETEKKRQQAAVEAKQQEDAIQARKERRKLIIQIAGAVALAAISAASAWFAARGGH